MNEMGKLSELRQIEVGKLVATQPYQTERNFPSTIKNIVNDFRVERLGVIVVSLRDGIYYVVDGKHRVAACKKLYGNDYLMDSKLFYGLTYQDEAIMFASQYDGVRTLTPYQKFVGKREGEDRIIVRINEILAKHGLEISQGSRDNGVQCIKLIEKIYKSIPDDFDKFIGIIVSIWGGEQTSLTNRIVQGMYRFYVTYQDEFDVKYLIDKLKKVNPQKIINDGDIDVSARGDIKYAKVIRLIYNKGKQIRNQLPYSFNG